MISEASFWRKTFQSSIFAELECVQLNTGRVSGSGTCVDRFHDISPSAGNALEADTVGIADVPTVHVRLSHGR